MYELTLVSMIIVTLQAAYSNNTLGLPRYVPAEQVDAMTASDLLTYCRTYHRPERMVLAGAGVDHDTLVDLARRHFVDKTPVWNERDDVTDIALDESVAQYTGGIIKVHISALMSTRSMCYTAIKSRNVNI